jgi:hypothetical protein
VLFGRCVFQPEPDFTVTRRGVTPFWIGAQIEFLVGQFGPAVFLHQLPERGLCLYQPLRVFRSGLIRFDQDSVGPMEGPVVLLVQQKVGALALFKIVAPLNARC